MQNECVAELLVWGVLGLQLDSDTIRSRVPLHVIRFEDCAHSGKGDCIKGTIDIVLVFVVCTQKFFSCVAAITITTTTCRRNITKTCLYNFDTLKPHFYIVKLGFTGVYIIFPISVQNIDCGTR